MSARKHPEPRIRQYRHTDDAQIWALAALPAAPAPDDDLPPVPLPGVDQPPPDLPDLADITERFVRAGGDFLVAEVSGDIVGTAGMLLADKDSADVVMVRVHPAMRRRGIATALLEALEWRAQGLGVHWLSLDVGDDHEAVAFYLASGYRRPDTEDDAEQERDLSRLSKALRMIP